MGQDMSGWTRRSWDADAQDAIVRAERDRFKAALEEIAGPPGLEQDDCVEIARAALTGSKADG